jgi:copper chaperone CopZ
MKNRTRAKKSTNIENEILMKKKFKIDGISCGGCITRLKKVLEAHDAINEVKIFLSPIGVAKINMNENLSVNDLQKQLDQLDGYTITEIG